TARKKQEKNRVEKKYQQYEIFRAVPEGIFNISQEERKNVCWTDQKEKEEDLSSISSFCPPEGIQARR
ncbi:hypothetical protein NE601_17320, partial [Erysipelatoclostridium ramosum]|nr:hypothetical protein [Thomasclavelia ramosa]